MQGSRPPGGGCTGGLPGVGGTLKVQIWPQPADGKRPRMEAGRELPSRRPLGLPMWHVEVLLRLRCAWPWRCALERSRAPPRRAGLACCWSAP